VPSNPLRQARITRRDGLKVDIDWDTIKWCLGFLNRAEHKIDTDPHGVPFDVQAGREVLEWLRARLQSSDEMDRVNTGDEWVRRS
jgi:hypothetical protein